MKKLLKENKEENTIVRAMIRIKEESYECVGVLVKEEKENLRIAFTAKEGTVKDHIDLKRKEVVSIEVIEPEKIKDI